MEMRHKVKSYNSVFAQTAYNMNIDADPELFSGVLCLTKSFCTFCIKRYYFYKVLDIAIQCPEDVIQEAATLFLEWKCLPIADQEEGHPVLEFVRRVQDNFNFHTLHGGKRYNVLCCTDVEVDSDVDVIDIAMLAERDLSNSDLEVTETIENIDVSVDVYNMKNMIGSCTVFIRPYITPSEYTRLSKFIETIDRKSDTQITALAVALEGRRKAVDREIARGRSTKEVDTYIYYESQRKPIGALL